MLEGLYIFCEPVAEIQVLNEGTFVGVCLHSVVYLCHMQQFSFLCAPLCAGMVCMRLKWISEYRRLSLLCFCLCAGQHPHQALLSSGRVGFPEGCRVMLAESVVKAQGGLPSCDVFKLSTKCDPGHSD